MQPNPYSLSARVTFPNPEKIKNELRELAREAIIKEPNILAIYLFGSRANGNFSARSDADLLIVLKQDRSRPLDRIPHYLEFFLKASIPVDVFPYTEEEIENNSFAQKARQEGVLLCSREPLKYKLKGSDHFNKG